MPATVMLTITRGKLQGQAFTFAERTTCIVGRFDDCHPRFPNDDDHRSISRHHCLLDINPPDIRVRDFGSRNGTFVNGTMIGKREVHMTPEEGARMQFREHDLKDGDELALGEAAAFRVGVIVLAACPKCGAELSESDQIVCKACEDKTSVTKELWNTLPVAPKSRTCAHCGKSVAAEVGADRPGDFLCAACQENPELLVKHLLQQARSGNEDLRALQDLSFVKELDRGGMGAVYLVHHDQTGEQAALKIMLPKVAVTEQSRQRFQREIECTRALRHPNVVQLREAVCTGGFFCFTLEFCDDGSVKDLLKQRGGTLPIAEAAAIVLQGLDGLDYAHHVELPQVPKPGGSTGSGRGLVHRDIKPANLFLSGKGAARIVKVGDYGLAKAFDAAGLSGLTRTGNMAGTLAFMPRQQLIDFKYAKPAVDVWGMAASLYNLLTGTYPRDFPPGRDGCLVILQDPTVPLRNRIASIPKKLAEVIDLALRDDPDLHFQTAVEFKRALENAL